MFVSGGGFPAVAIWLYRLTGKRRGGNTANAREIGLASMAIIEPGGIDCDLHPAVPNLEALYPYLSDHWRDIATQRGLHELNSIAYPAHSPLSARPDWRTEGVVPGSRLDQVRSQALDPFKTSLAVANCLYGAQLLFSEDMGAAFARAINDWMVHEWLDREPRLRASIVIPIQNPEMAVEEIGRLAPDRRFVQVLMLVMNDMPLGKRHYWPIYAAAERHGLTIGIHAGSAYRHPVTSLGWPSYYTEDYAAQAAAFQQALSSLICEGVFVKYPNLKAVLLESGVSWLPAQLWRLTKFWRGLRMEIPWLDRTPTDVVKTNVRLTIQPLDTPPNEASLLKLLDHLESDDLLLFSTDYPHWQFDDDDVLPAGLPQSLVRKIMIDNPKATYPRLQ
jgi:uncharacterized protein